jgi:hypothetical protein
MHYYHVGMANQVIPWTKQMFKIFREKRGYDLKPFLPALFLDMGEQTAKIRYDFWRTLSEQYSDSYYKQIKDWCESNGVLFTGHLLGEEWMWMHARCEGNIFEHLKHMHITGVDHLYPVIGTEENPDQHVALKIASSAAHHYGSTRLLCESMGGTYWDCSLERMKWIANWEYALGVNIFNNHGYHYSIEGERKRDWPPSQFYHHTWWKYYNFFTEYMARLGHLLSGGKHVAKILVLYPISSVWTNYKPSGATDIFNLIQGEFNFLTDALLRLHYDFDYVDETILNEAKVENGKIKIKDEEYSLVILPPATHIKGDTLKTLKKFTGSGGKLIADTLIPVDLLEYNKKDSKKQIKDLFGVESEKLFAKYSSAAKAQLIKTNTKNVFVLQGSGLSKTRDYKLLKSVIEKCITPDVTISDKDVLYLHRVKDGIDLYYFVNTTRHAKHNVEITLESIGIPEIWDANTGEVKPLHVFDIKKNRLFFTLDLAETDTQIIRVIPNKINAFVKETNLFVESFTDAEISGYLKKDGSKVSAKIVKDGKTTNLSTTIKKSLPNLSFKNDFNLKLEDDNVLCVSNWKMKLVEGEDTSNYIKPDFDDSQWLNVTLGAWEMQLPQERDDAIYPETVWYRTSFSINDIPERIAVLIDGFSGKEYELFINGMKVTDKGIRSKLDAEIKEINIKDYVKEGVNNVAVKLIVERRTDGILDLLKIVGSFALSKQKNRYAIDSLTEKIKLGDWTKQGYPFYSGTCDYIQKINIPKHYLDGKLFLEVECGEDVLEVSINNGKSLVAPWHPYLIDITGLVNEGENEFVFKVTNTLINVLEAVQKESGLFKSPRIIHYNKYTLTF